MIYIFGILFTSLMGTIGHFLYKFTNKDKIIGFLFSTNESLYEHLKLGFTPMLMWMIVENFKLMNNHSLIVMKGLSMLVFILILIIPYLITAKIFHKNYTFINLASFYIGIIMSYLTTFLLNNKIYLSNVSKFVGIIVFILVIASYFVSKMKIKKRATRHA